MHDVPYLYGVCVSRMAKILGTRVTFPKGRKTHGILASYDSVKGLGSYNNIAKLGCRSKINIRAELNATGKFRGT